MHADVAAMRPIVAVFLYFWVDRAVILAGQFHAITGFHDLHQVPSADTWNITGHRILFIITTTTP
jgi:hypothetical protein